MGIYTDGLIRGVQISIYRPETSTYETVYEQKYNTVMNAEQINQTKQYFETFVSDFDKTHTILSKNTETEDPYVIRFYVETSSTYGNGCFMSWWKCNNIQIFIRWLNHENISKNIFF